MGFKKWLAKKLGSKEKPVYASPEERNAKVREYQTFIKDYTRIYGGEAVSTEFVANGENAPSHRLWLTGRDRGVRDTFASLPLEVRSKLKPVYSLPPRKIVALPEVYQAFNAKRVSVEDAAYALGFDSVDGFAQVMQWLNSLAKENLMLKQSIDKLQHPPALPVKKRRTRGPNKKKPEPVTPSNVPELKQEPKQTEEVDGNV